MSFSICSSLKRLRSWLASMKPIEPWVWATATSRDCGGILVIASSTWIMMLPTCGPLPWTIASS